MRGLVDTHCHLSHVDGEPDDVLAEADREGVTWLVDVGMGTSDSRLAVARAEASDGRAYASVGLHPNDLGEFSDDAMETLARLGRSPACVAVGETGLDFYRDREPAGRQEAAFRAHIDLAKRLDRALVIHCRDADGASGASSAHAAVLRVLDDAGPPERVVMHCFSGDGAYAAECVRRGFFCSFAGNVTYRRNDELRRAAAAVPDELVLVETDAPFLAPVPHRGKANRPGFVRFTASVVATARGVDPDAFVERVRTNAHTAFGVPG